MNQIIPKCFSRDFKQKSNIFLSFSLLNISTYCETIHFPKTHLNFKDFKLNQSSIEKNIQNRKVEGDISKVVEIYEKKIQIHFDIEQIRNKRKHNSKEIKSKEINAEQRTNFVELGKKLKNEENEKQIELNKIEAELMPLALKIPNNTSEFTPIGDESKAIEVEIVGEKPSFTDSEGKQFQPKDHIELCEIHDLVDFKSGSKTAGHKFIYLKNEAALLEIALTNWVIQKLTLEWGYTPVLTPDVTHPFIAESCGFNPKEREVENLIYSIQGQPLCLIGTSEITLGGMYLDSIIPKEKLPVKLVGFSHCFRKEVGQGKQSKGLYRVHQFSKVELFSITNPEDSEITHLEMLYIQKQIYKELGLHFRVLEMPTEELGAPAYRKFDIEAWIPSHNSFGEITSTSNCTDYQSRRLNIRTKNLQNQKELDQNPNIFVHTVNGTACAIPRIILSILENFQQSDGSVLIPEPLIPFMGGKTRIESK